MNSLSRMDYPRTFTPDFIQEITKNFLPILSTYSKMKDGDLYAFQKFVSLYMNPHSPYRGVLLYYGLGAGKTRTAIAACDSFIQRGRNVCVLLPASLRSNFLGEYESFRNYLIENGSSRGIAEEDSLDKYFTFHHYNAGTSFAKSRKTEDDGSFDKEDLEGKVLVIDEMHNFVSLLANALRSKRYRGEAVYRKIMNTKDLRIIALSGTPIINLPFEVAILVNLLAGYKKADHSPWDGISEPISLFPESEEKFNELYLDTTNSKQLQIKAESQNDFCRRLVGQISYYGGVTGKDVYPQLDQIVVKIPMSNYQFKTYIDQRETELNETARTLRLDNYVPKEGLDRELMEKKSSFRASTREICNFAFPKAITRPWRRELAASMRLSLKEKEKKIRINRLNMEFVGEEVVHEPEVYHVKQQNIEQEYLSRLDNAVKELYTKKNLYLKTKLNDKSMMEYMEMQVKTPDPRDEYDTETHQYLQLHLNESYSDASLTTDEKRVTNTLGIYSPKMLSILYNIENHRLLDESRTDEIRKDGNVVVYSCFNKVEGISIFTQVLEASGYSPYVLGEGPKNSDSKGRYCFWQGKDKARILEVFNSDENRYGDIIKILLITEAGAEGITVKNVRHMHIMEPYWNEVQIRQVIGRAKRMYSHKALKPQERHVQVYRYKMTFTDEQKKFITGHLRWNLDEQFTTDEVVSLIAQKKKTVTDQVERFMKQTAVDCFLNKEDNDSHETVPFECYSITTKGKNVETYKLGATIKEITQTTALDLDKTEKKVTTFYDLRMIHNGVLDPTKYAFKKEVVSKKTSSGNKVEIVVLKIYPKIYISSGLIDENQLIGKVYLVSKEGEDPIYLSREGRIIARKEGEAGESREDKHAKYKQYIKNNVVYLESI